MHDTLKRLHRRQRGTGTTIDHFRLNEVDPSQAAIAFAQRHETEAATFTVGVPQALPLPGSSFDVVTCTLAIHHVPARKREAAFREMYRVTRPGGRLLAADYDPSRWPLRLHPGARRMHRAVATAGPLEDLATAARYRVKSSAGLPLLRYVLAARPEHDATP